MRCWSSVVLWLWLLWLCLLCSLLLCWLLSNFWSVSGFDFEVLSHSQSTLELLALSTYSKLILTLFHKNNACSLGWRAYTWRLCWLLSFCVCLCCLSVFELQINLEGESLITRAKLHLVLFPLNYHPLSLSSRILSLDDVVGSCQSNLATFHWCGSVARVNPDTFPRQRLHCVPRMYVATKTCEYTYLS